MAKRNSNTVETINTVTEIDTPEVVVEVEELETIDTPTVVEAVETPEPAQDTPVTEGAGEMASIGQLVDHIVGAVPGDTFTMYQTAKILNSILELLQIQKDGKAYQVRPQMIYNYNRNKMVVKGHVVDVVSKGQMAEFITKFVEKRSK